MASPGEPMNSDVDNFYALTPDGVLEAVESQGYYLTGEYYQLNSYENRVFDLKLEAEDSPEELNQRIIVKFYRPGRWSQQAVLEEHEFMQQLKSEGIPAVAPLTLSNGSSLFNFSGMNTTLFPKAFGRMPQELMSDDLRRIGRLLARLHNVGEQQTARHRPSLHPDEYGWPNIELLEKWVAPEVWPRYQKAAQEICSFLDSELNPEEFIRIHGDCHKGNILLKDQRDQDTEYFFVDFDDFCNGPVAQDFWMLFSEQDGHNQDELADILEGYEELRHIPMAQLKLFPALRGLRIIHYAAWIARRWEDPSFPNLFPSFREYIYWAEEVEALERIAWSL